MRLAAVAEAARLEEARLFAIANPFPTMPRMTRPGPSDSISGGGWTRVRHTAAGNSWGPFTDRSAGTDVIGNPQDDSSHWTVRFSDLPFTEMLYASGDMQDWLVIPRSNAIGR